MTIFDIVDTYCYGFKLLEVITRIHVAQIKENCLGTGKLDSLKVDTNACGAWLNKLKYFIAVHCLDNSENIAVSIATNVSVCDVHVTQRNAWPSCLAFMRLLLHKSTPVVKEASKQQQVASRWHNLPFYEEVTIE